MDSVPSHVQAAVEAGVDCSVTHWHRPAEGRIAETYVLDLDADPGRAVCKVGSPSVRTGDVVEPLVLDLLSGTDGLPIPDLYAHGTFEEQTDFRQYWALYECRPGEVPTPFDSLAPAVRRRIVHHSGSILGRLHATYQFERTGGFGRTGDRLSICSPDGLYVPERGRRLLERLRGLDTEFQPVLCHGDLFPGNLLADESGTITGLIDWANAHVSTAGYALARAEMRFVDWFRFPSAEQQRLRTELKKGYRQHRTLPPEYPSVSALYKGLWLAQSADRVCRHLGSRRGREQMRRHLRSLLP